MEINDLEKKLSVNDPIKVLALNYLESILIPQQSEENWYVPMPREIYEKFKEVLFLMLDVAYQHGVQGAVMQFQTLVWDQGQNGPGAVTKDIREICKIVEDFNLNRPKNVRYDQPNMMPEPEIILPRHGEVWEKKPCARGICSVGWSLGAGTHKIDKMTGMDWGTTAQIEHGCLVKISDSDYVLERVANKDMIFKDKDLDIEI